MTIPMNDTADRLANALAIFHQASRTHEQTVRAHNELTDVLNPIHRTISEQVRADLDPATGKKLYTNDDARRYEVERRMLAEQGDRVVRLAELENRLQDTRAALERAREELHTLRAQLQYETAVLYDRWAEKRVREVLRG